MDVRRAVRIGAPVAWLLASAAMVATVGVPTSHDLVFVWFATGMIAVSVSRFRRSVRRLVIEWAPFMFVLFIYDQLRGIADGMLVHTRVIPQVRFDSLVFGKPIPTVWLQQHLWHGGDDLHWWDYLTWFVYLTHFFGTLVVAAILWRFAHQHFARFATMVCVLALTGFATYVLYPADPPWLAARQGEIGEANRTIAVTWHHVPITHFGSLFEKGQRYANNVAAMPSLHAAYALLLALFLWRVLPRWTRPLLVLYPPAMAFSLIYGGEHFVIDCLAGWVYATFAFVAVNWAFERRERRLRTLEPAFAD